MFILLFVVCLFIRLTSSGEPLDHSDRLADAGLLDGDEVVLVARVSVMVSKVLPLLGLSQSGKDLLKHLLAGKSGSDLSGVVQRMLRRTSSMLLKQGVCVGREGGGVHSECSDTSTGLTCSCFPH